mmetsp:Transcript_34739/g.83953  ORF Transcript_34739/g.83953 Transcript_34739/m.83953 type:complete len:213 (-) Transcript_34739:297-935(-)
MSRPLLPTPPLPPDPRSCECCHLMPRFPIVATRGVLTRRAPPPMPSFDFPPSAFRFASDSRYSQSFSVCSTSLPSSSSFVPFGIAMAGLFVPFLDSAVISEDCWASTQDRAIDLVASIIQLLQSSMSHAAAAFVSNGCPVTKGFSFVATPPTPPWEMTVVSKRSPPLPASEALCRSFLRLALTCNTFCPSSPVAPPSSPACFFKSCFPSLLS